MYRQVTFGHLNATKVSADLVLNEYTLFKTILAERSKKQKGPEFNDPEWYYPLEEQINALEKEMQNLVAQDKKIMSRFVSYHV